MQERKANICAVITEETVKDARLAIEFANTQADMIEVRLDYLRDFDFQSVENLSQLLSNRKLPTIITCRSVEEGGKQKIRDATRLPLLIEGAKRFAEYCDIEAAHYDAASTLQPDISKLIVSYHNFNETPENLDLIYEQLIRLPAKIHKIAVRTNQITDSLKIFTVLNRARQDERQLIAIAMNEAGIMTRLLGCAFGSFLTYGSLQEGKQSAAGQISCQELKELYRINSISENTHIYGIIGNPVSNSLSPIIHNSMFKSLNLDAVYLPLQIDNLESFFTKFVKQESREIALNFRGFSVTIPHKLEVMPQLDSTDATAATIGAVNTIVIENGRLLGYNTDVDGALQPLDKLSSLEGETCAVIGGGGAARAVIYGLLQRKAKVTVFVRNPKKANQLARDFGVEVLPIERLKTNNANILINTSPIGMRGYQEEESLFPAESVKGRSIVYDLVYNPLETRLFKEAQSSGCITINGLEMLISQACLQFQLWTRKQPDYDLMYHSALNKLSELI